MWLNLRPNGLRLMQKQLARLVKVQGEDGAAAFVETCRVDDWENDAIRWTTGGHAVVLNGSRSGGCALEIHIAKYNWGRSQESQAAA